MGRTRRGKTAIAFAMVFLATGSARASTITFEAGTYVLGNRPYGGAAASTYALRFDNLSRGGSPFTFDFDCMDYGVTLVYDGATIDISGKAFGGLHDDGDYDDCDFGGMYEE